MIFKRKTIKELILYSISLRDRYNFVNIINEMINKIHNVIIDTLFKESVLINPKVHRINNKTYKPRLSALCKYLLLIYIPSLCAYYIDKSIICKFYQ